MTRSANADARGTDHHRRNAPFFLPNRFLGATNSQPYAHCVASRPYGHWCATTSLWPVPLAVAAVKASSHGPAFCQAAYSAAAESPRAIDLESRVFAVSVGELIGVAQGPGR